MHMYVHAHVHMCMCMQEERLTDWLIAYWLTD
jgi:hypothetical protein